MQKLKEIYFKPENIIPGNIKSNIIDVDYFNFIIQKSNAESWKLHNFKIPKYRFWGNNLGLFQYSFIKKENSYINFTETNYLSPQYISFYDKINSVTYLISKIDNKLQLSSINLKKIKRTEEIPHFLKPVKNSRILKKIEWSFQSLDNAISNNFYEQARRRIQSGNIQLLSKEQQDSYINISKLCLNKKYWEKAKNFFSSLNNYDGESKYYTTLNFVMEYFDEEEIHFIMGLDWKFGVEDLEWRISSALKQNFGLSLELPSKNDFQDGAAIHWTSIFEAFETVLNKYSFQIGFIKTDGDEYIILIHKSDNFNRISKLVNVLGYRYLNVEKIKYF